MIWRMALATGLASLLTVAGCGGSKDWGDEATKATAPAPEVQTPAPGSRAVLQSWPLLFDRLRVVGQRHRVLAQPLAAPGDAPAHWSYERRSSKLNSLALLRPARRGPVIASLWTDAGIVGLDASTGEVLWRSEAVSFGIGPLSFPFDPSKLVGSPGFRSVSTAGGDILVVKINHDFVGVDPVSGKRLWRVTNAGCTESEYDPMAWWPVSGSLVVNATCRQGSVMNQGPGTVHVFDARTGAKTETFNVDPQASSSHFRAIGCDVRPADCAGVVQYPIGETHGRKSKSLTVRDGRLVPYEATGSAANDNPIEVRRNGDFQLFGYDMGTDNVRWKVNGQAHDLNRVQFFDVDVIRDTTWVASHSWNGGPPALVRINRADGKVTGCEPPPAGAPTRIEAHDGGYLVVGDLPTERTEAYDSDNPDGAVVLLVPNPTSTCPR